MAQPAENTNFSRSALLAPLTSRALAAFIDYLLVMALLMFFSGFLVGFDFEFLLSLLLGALYFSIGNSEVFNGQTLGKRAMGIQVRGADGLIPLPHSLLRYLFAFGIPILVSGLPPLLLRSRGIVAEPRWTELHMLFVLVYSAANFSAILFDRRQRALHDRIVRTLVVCADAKVDTDLLHAYLRPGSDDGLRGIAPFLAGGLLGTLLWLYSVKQPPQLLPFHTHRFRIEQQFQVRILSLSFDTERLIVQMAGLFPAKPPPAERLDRIARYVQDTKLLPGMLEKLDITVFPVLDPQGAAKPQQFVYVRKEGKLTAAPVASENNESNSPEPNKEDERV